jgi:hypothetical protein
MTCIKLHDRHFCYMSFLSATESRAIQNNDAREAMRELAAMKMVAFDGETARLLPDGESALQDYRELGADV